MDQPIHSETLGLTPKMKAGKEFIATYSLQHGHSPSYQEIADNLGLKSKANVKHLVDRLVSRGHATHKRGSARTIQIIDGICPTCGHHGTPHE